jgi:SAM-dependent methyltransferase
MRGVDGDLEKLLACPRCHAAISVEGAAVRCTADACTFTGALVDGIVDASGGGGGGSFFDHRFTVMMHGSDQPGPRAAFYTQQQEALRSRLNGVRVVLDVGCGPRLAYSRPHGSFVIGVDPSRESLRRNEELDLRLYGSATALPLSNNSVDAIVCFYSLHHFVGATIAENEELVRAAFREFFRVLAVGGHLIIFEVAPWRSAWVLQRAVWNVARRLAREATAMFFWPHRTLARLAADYVPARSELEYHAFPVSPWTTFPPAFALQRFRLPRLLYPFEICMLHWRLAPVTTGQEAKKP